MSFNRSTLSPTEKHNHLLAVYENIHDHCENFGIIYQYLLDGNCSPEIIEEIHQTTEKLSQQGHDNLLITKSQTLQTTLDRIHTQEATEAENADDILLAIDDE